MTLVNSLVIWCDAGAEPMKSRKPGGVPYRKPPFAWQLAEQGRTVSGETAVSSEGSPDTCSSQHDSLLQNMSVL